MTVAPATLGAIHARFAGGDPAGAWAQLEPLVRAGTDPAALQLAGMIRRGLGDLTGARDWFARAGAAGNGEALNMLGNLLVDLGDDSGADAAFARAAALAPADPNPWINRGRLASRQGRHDVALAQLDQAVALAPHSVIAAVARGNARRASGDADAAVAELTRARALDPGRASTGVHLGVALTAAERPAEAIAAFDAVERAGGGSAEVTHNRAAALVALGDLEAAALTYDRLVADFPTYLPGHRERARWIQEYDRPGDPLASFAALAARYPREPAVWEAWAQALLEFGRNAAAAETAAHGRASAGDTPTLRLAAAMGLAESGALAEAAAAFEALDTAGIAISGQAISHARLRLRLGQPDRAARIAETAIATDRDDQTAWAYLGIAWRLLDDPREFWLHDYERHVGVMVPSAPQIDDAARFVADTADVLRALHVTRAQPINQSLRHGTQTSGALFLRRKPAIRAVVAAVEGAVARFVAALPDDADHPLLSRKADRFRFSGSWSVRLTERGFHVAHVHREGWISSAFYFVLPDRDGDEGALMLGKPPADLGLDLSPRRIVRPEPGQLILFPSSMWHGTVPFARTGERITVAFDVVPD